MDRRRWHTRYDSTYSGGGPRNRGGFRPGPFRQCQLFAFFLDRQGPFAGFAGPIYAGGVVADDWQGKGIGRELMQHLFVVAEDAGFERIEGAVLKANGNMLRFCRELGFQVSAYPGDAQLVLVAKDF
jgi:GNAT superfamily N-acetyltransferase